MEMLSHGGRGGLKAEFIDSKILNNCRYRQQFHPKEKQPVMFNATNPEENLARDEAMLLGQTEGVRVWESATYFVVLGRGGSVADDVHEDECAAMGVPILRRCSGGGTVVQGPGCLNYCVVLDAHKTPEVATIAGTTQFVLSRVIAAVREAGGGELVVPGVSDLATPDGFKVSGNAQKRRKNWVLFHGTLLYNFDLPLVSRLLKEPPVRPPWRGERSHNSFVKNLNHAFNVEQFVVALHRMWGK